MTHEDTSEEQSAFVLVDFNIPQRQKPVIHPAVDAPLCDNCRRLELGFFDPNCPGCREILSCPATTIAEVFAILRQWVPQIQKNICIFIDEILKRGAHINDRDGLTDMTLLHYASKSGASGVGDPQKTETAVLSLLQKGAAVNLFSRWTHMTALHYATYFDCAAVVELLLKASKGIDVNKPCSDFDNGTPLHIAAGNLCLETAISFLKNGANPIIKDDLDRTPLGCVPDEGMFDPDSEMSTLALNMKKLLREAEESITSLNSSSSGGRAILQSMGIKLGDKVIVGGLKIGTLRFYGTTEFASGSWAGIELDEPSGKNDGSVQGISYFKCPDKYGIFAPINKISKINCNSTFNAKLSRSSSFSSRQSTPSTTPTSNPYRHMSWTDSSLSNSRLSSPLNSTTEFQMGDRVIVGGNRKGQILFYGETHFSPGWWYGIELDNPVGKNDGSIGGTRYFTCKPSHGIFAPPSRVKRLLVQQSSDSVHSLDTTYLIPGRSNLLRNLTGSQSSLSSISSTGSRNRFVPSRKNVALRSNSEFRLVEGMNVFVIGEIGTVRFIGPTDFGDGVWLGIELRNPKGKNDGSVQGKRYFSCKPNYGLLVRPSKVTVRGINGSRLLDDI